MIMDKLVSVVFFSQHELNFDKIKLSPRKYRVPVPLKHCYWIIMRY